MTTPISEHEKLFDEICNKLHELSGHPNGSSEIQAPEDDGSTGARAKYEKMQVQMQKFQEDLQESHEELREKIKSFECSTTVHTEVSIQLRQLTEQLAAERMSNTKLSSDLARSLELCLQLQLEIQGLKSRAMHIQNEEKKYSQSLFDKNRSLQKDLELMTALKEDLSTEMYKAQSVFCEEKESWEQSKVRFEAEIVGYKNNLDDSAKETAELKSLLEEKIQRIGELNKEVEKISYSFGQVENSAQKQSEVMKDLMGVAETKIVEMKLSLDKKVLESQDYYNHLQQALTQVSVLKQENLALKDYINKLNVYHQQSQQQY